MASINSTIFNTQEANFLSLLGTGLICVFGLPPNGLLLYLILKRFRTTKPHEWLIFNLTLVDFLLCLNGVTLQVPFSYFVIEQSDVLCKIGGLWNVVFSLIGIFSVPNISFNRYVSLYYPQKYKSIFKRNCVAVVCVVLWTFWILMTIPVIIQGGAGFDQATGICAIIITTSIPFQAIMALIIACLTVMSNCTAGYFAYKVIKRIHQHKTGMVQSNIKSQVTEESRQLIVVVALILTVPLFTHVPFIMLRVVQIEHDVNRLISGLITGLFPLGQCVNPFLTIFGVKRYKQIIMQMFCSCKNEIRPTKSEPTGQATTSNTVHQKLFTRVDRTVHHMHN